MNFSKVKKIILNPLVGIPIFVLFFLIFPTFLIVFYELSLKEFLILLVGILLFLEVFFNFVFRLINGHKYKSPKKVPFKDLHIEPHPYIPYIYKRNFKSPPAEETRYPLHRGEFSTCDLRTNNFKFFNGPGGNRDIVVPKPKDLFRITCIGASTTQNYISFNNKNYSYPMELENILKKKQFIFCIQFLNDCSNLLLSRKLAVFYFLSNQFAINWVNTELRIDFLFVS